MKGRHSQRVLAFQAMYMYEMFVSGVFGYDIDDLTSFPWIEEGKTREKGDCTFAISLLGSCIKYLSDIDMKLKKNLTNHMFGDIDLVTKSILRIAITELYFIHPVSDTNLVIDEAVVSAKTYASDHAYKFVNGVLEAVVHPA